MPIVDTASLMELQNIRKAQVRTNQLLEGILQAVGGHLPPPPPPSEQKKGLRRFKPD